MEGRRPGCHAPRPFRRALNGREWKMTRLLDEEIYKAIEKGLGSLAADMSREGGHYSIKAEEEMHPFLAAYIFQEVEGPLLADIYPAVRRV
jgi:hypothetical protein